MDSETRTGLEVEVVFEQGMPLNRQRISVSLVCHRTRTLGARTYPLILVSTVFAAHGVTVVAAIPLTVSMVVFEGQI